MKQGALTNIAGHLPEMARLQPHTPAVFFPHGRDRGGRICYTHYTFSQLDRESNRIAHALAYGRSFAHGCSHCHGGAVPCYAFALHPDDNRRAGKRRL